VGLLNELVDGAIAFALAVSQVVAFVENNEAEAAGNIGQVTRDTAQRNDLGLQTISFGVVLPHLDEVLRTKDERADAAFVLNHASERRRHQRLAEPHHVSDENAAALIDVMSRNSNCRTLKLKELSAKFDRDSELR